jgi:hypothetical protein
MKRFLGLGLLAGLVATTAFSQTGGKLNDAERTFLIDQLELSKKNFLASIAGLSEAQWRFKAAPEKWSVAECAEHLVLAEDFLFASTQGILKSPATERLASSNSQVDHALVAGVLDRSKKATAPEPITPAGGKFATPGEAAKEFTIRRDKTIAYAKSTQDDLRIHSAPGPLGPMDAYQFLLLIASHAGRHTLQIKEVEANPAYPKMTAKVPFE